MPFLRTRTIKGKTYSYWEERYREGGKVKSRHLGKRFLPAPVAPENQGWAYIERLMEKYPGDPLTSKPQDHSTPQAPVQSPSHPTEQATQEADAQPGSAPSTEGSTSATY